MVHSEYPSAVNGSYDELEAGHNGSEISQPLAASFAN